MLMILLGVVVLLGLAAAGGGGGDGGSPTGGVDIGITIPQSDIMRIFIPIILFLLIACDDINNHEKLGSLTIAFNTSLIDSQPSNSLNRLENSESIAPINLAVIKIGDNSPVNINLTSFITNAYTATNLPSGPTQVIVELYSKGVLLSLIHI